MWRGRRWKAWATTTAAATACTSNDGADDGSSGDGGTGKPQAIKVTPLQPAHLPFFRSPLTVTDLATGVQSSPWGRVFLVVLGGKTSPPSEPPSADLESAHLKHLYALNAVGRLLACSHYASGTHGMLVLLADSQEEAEAIVNMDPLLLRNYYSSFEIHELESPDPPPERQLHVS